MKPKNVIFWGGTGQAKVVRPIIEAYGGKLVAVFDDNPKLPPPFPDVPLFYGNRQSGVPSLKLRQAQSRCRDRQRQTDNFNRL